MSEARRRILQMVADGKLTVAEAEELLAATETRRSDAETGPEDEAAEVPTKSRSRYLRVVVEPSEENPRGDRVNVRIPLGLIRAGVKFGALLPAQARSKVSDALKEKGMDVDWHRMKPDDMDELIDHLAELTVDVDSGTEKVRVFCE